jgi:RNA polymerase sigma factor for flagellar operon FliA
MSVQVIAPSVTNFESTATIRRNILIRDHAAIARRIALRVARRCPNWVAREDLVAAGMLGLIEAAERFDKSRAEPFLAFATYRIRGAVLDELRRGDMVPRRERQLGRKVAATAAELERKEGAPPADERVAEVLGISIEDYRASVAQLAMEIKSVEGEHVTLVADAAEAPDVKADHQRSVARMSIALSNLSERECSILEMYFVDEQSYQEIAKVLGVSASRVCQLLWRAIARMREELEAAPEAA